MRISLLLEREPFGEILEKTLVAYWTSQTGREVRVRWKIGRPQQKARAQTWLVNIYLNAIFTPQLETSAFDPIRREFSHSLVWWRRPLQRAYVAAATAKVGASWLAQASLQVSPPVPGSEHLLIVPGNHKIRLLDYHKGEATLLLKASFPTHFWRQELEARQAAISSGLPVPELLRSNAEGNWYIERYISGTPLNRLPDVAQAQRALAQIRPQLARFYEQTRSEIALDVYVSELGQRINDLAACNPLLKSEQIQTIQICTQALQARLVAPSKKLSTCLAHGDFQPANLLNDGSQTWLIDWEYATRRQMGYDMLVYNLGTRSPQGLAARLLDFVTQGLSLALPLDVPLRSQDERQLAADLFLLEELHLHLVENDNPLFRRVGAGLLILVNEIEQWLEW